MGKHLSDATVQHLTIGELHALCHELGVEYGTLRGKNGEAKARDLFSLMQTQGRLDELAEAIQPKQPRAAARIERITSHDRHLLLTIAAPLIIVAAIALAALLATMSGGKEGVQATSTAQIRQQVRMEPAPATATPTPSPMPVLTGQYAISYTDAASWLETLPPEDHGDQILDWAMWGLAGFLELDTKTLRNAFYDQAMLRDPVFEGLAAYRVGAGRGFADAGGTLHLLAPAAETGAPRAIGMVLDDYRKDAGIDPAQVLIYRYEIDGEGQQVILTPDELRPVEVVRQAYGYREMQVDGRAALQRFLNETEHLSCLELRQGRLWAGGWHWPDSPTGRVTAQDLTALQRGYRRAVQGLSPEPGFSLDAGEPMTVADLLELFDPARYPKLARYKQELAAFVAEWSQADTEQAQSRVVQRHRDLVQNLLDDEEYLQLLEFLMHTAGGRPPYQKARY
ncbi:MAG: hypothetical protein JXA14_04930, partial [Anaerolineae bacterium]|nr:hypothetical protein [Anaerolineae bacterium]